METGSRNIRRTARKWALTSSICLACSVAIPAFGDSTPPSQGPRADLPIPLLTLPAVQNVREKNTRWQEAAQLALNDIHNKSLRDQINQRLNAVAPEVAKDLLTKPDSQAIVTVAIYKNPKTNRQALAAVAYEGRSDGLNPGFYSRVIADLPAAPRVSKTQEQLVLDELATCYLCFYLDHGNLDAGRIPHALMKQSVQKAAQTFLAKENEGQAQLATAHVPATPPPAVPQQPATAPPVDQTPTNGAPIYGNSYTGDGLYDGYYGPGYWSPWVAYFPGEVTTPIIVNPLDQREREKREREHQEANSPTAIRRDPRTGQVLPPAPLEKSAQPAPRDPRTGQPLPPAGAGGPSAPANTTPPANQAPSNPPQRSEAKQPPPAHENHPSSPPPAREAPHEAPAQQSHSAPARTPPAEHNEPTRKQS